MPGSPGPREPASSSRARSRGSSEQPGQRQGLAGRDRERRRARGGPAGARDQCREPAPGAQARPRPLAGQHLHHRDRAPARHPGSADPGGLCGLRRPFRHGLLSSPRGSRHRRPPAALGRADRPRCRPRRSRPAAAGRSGPGLSRARKCRGRACLGRADGLRPAPHAGRGPAGGGALGHHGLRRARPQHHDNGGRAARRGPRRRQRRMAAPGPFRPRLDRRPLGPLAAQALYQGRALEEGVVAFWHRHRRRAPRR
jgi:hypothetical protein